MINEIYTFKDESTIEYKNGICLSEFRYYQRVGEIGEHPWDELKTYRVGPQHYPIFLPRERIEQYLSFLKDHRLIVLDVDHQLFITFTNKQFSKSFMLVNLSPVRWVWEKPEKVEAILQIYEKTSLTGRQAFAVGSLLRTYSRDLFSFCCDNHQYTEVVPEMFREKLNYILNPNNTIHHNLQKTYFQPGWRIDDKITLEKIEKLGERVE